MMHEKKRRVTSRYNGFASRDCNPSSHKTDSVTDFFAKREELFGICTASQPEVFGVRDVDVAKGALARQIYKCS